VFDLAKDRDRPYAVLTGDTLFLGDVGRPDLRASLGWTAQLVRTRGAGFVRTFAEHIQDPIFRSPSSHALTRRLNVIS
jgi:hypothetical protein